ncbi:MAG: hypothetical protein U9R08_06655 [Nanoarchaeota archaeon]|nr:hypothetical protein [Nanoarchaeota archaeon]
MAEEIGQEQKFVKDMLERAQKKDEEKKIILMKDVDIKKVEELTKELQEKIQRGKETKF